MPTSGSVDFQHTRTQIVESALRKCGVLREGVSASANQLTTGSLALNAIVKSLAVDGMPLWAIRKSAIFPIHDTNSVILGPSGGHAATTYNHTELTAESAATDTTLTVDSITGIAASDIIGVELDSGNIFWSTVSGAPSGSTVTLAAGVTTVASSGNHVYSYTNKTVRPLKIVQAQRYSYEQDSEVPINIVSRDEYVRLSTKSTEGPPHTIYYEPTSLTGLLNLYPRFENGDEVILIWFQRPFEDMDNSTDNLDFPQEYELLIILMLATTLGYEYSIPSRKLGMLQTWTEAERKRVGDFGMEEGSVYLTPNRTGR